MAGALIEGSVTEVALAANTTTSILRVKAPANQGLVVVAWGVFFDGVTPTDQPLECWLQKETTDGTYTSMNPVKVNGFSWNVQSTWGNTGSPAGTAGDIHDPVEVHPQQGYAILFPLGQEIIVAAGERLAVVAKNPTGNTAVNCRAKIKLWE